MRKELTEEQVAEIKRLKDGGMNQKQIAEKVGTSSSSVCKYLKQVTVGDSVPGTSKFITDTSRKTNSRKTNTGLHQSIGDEIIKRKVTIDKLQDEVDILEKAVELMEGS